MLYILNKAIKQGKKVTVQVSDIILCSVGCTENHSSRLAVEYTILSSPCPDLMLRKQKLGFFWFVFSEEISRVCLALLCRVFPRATGNSIIKRKGTETFTKCHDFSSRYFEKDQQTRIKVARILITFQETETMPTCENHSKSAIQDFSQSQQKLITVHKTK